MPPGHQPLLDGRLPVTASPNVALVFPGQGTQWVGMGSALVQRYAEAREAFGEADDALGESISSLCFEGPESALSATASAQPAILTCSIAAWRVIASRLPAAPVAAAGHSLGEFSALVAAGSLCLADGVRFVRARGRLMDAAGRRENGAGMLAVLGLEAEDAEAIAAQAAAQSGTPVSLANVNCPGQVVLGGAVAGLELAAELARAHGAKRTQRLPISVASHTPMMHEAAAELVHLAAQLDLSSPAFPLVGNAFPVALTDADALRREIGAQLETRIDWPRCVDSLAALGATEFWEVGPKSVLAGLCKRIGGAPPVRTLVTVDEMSRLIETQVEA